MKNSLLIFVLLPLITMGQIMPDNLNKTFTSSIQEDVIYFTDRDLYLSGETIWFTAFITTNTSMTKTAISKVLYVELYDKSSKVIQKAKFAIQENLCSGSLTIPNETLSEVYFLRAYTQFQRNRSISNFSYIPLSIVNPELTLTRSGAKSIQASMIQQTQQKTLTINTNKSKYSTREKVDLKLGSKEIENALVCISVIKQGTSIPYAKAKNDNTEITQSNDSIFWLPDVRGTSLSGFVRDKQSNLPAKNVDVYLSAFGESLIFHISETQENGSFIFPLDHLKRSQDIFVSIDPQQHTNMEVLINNDFSNQFSRLPDYPFRIDTSYEKLLTEMYINHQASTTFEIAYSAEQADEPFTNLPSNYEIVIRLNDYIELSSLEEVIYEIVPPVFVKSTKEEKYLSVANYATQQVSRAGLILLDNVPIFDVDELLKLAPANIESIEVINKPYYLGNHLLESIVSFKTKTGDFGGYKFPTESIFLEFQTLSLQQTFITPNYGIDSIKNNPLPDFRTSMYWNPELQLNATDTSIGFYTSDARGHYDIIVRGITTTGEAIFGKAELVVE
jgi:hypothetical protein